MKRFLLLQLIVAILFVLSGIAPARATTMPLIMQIRGDEWAWEGPNSQVKQLTTWGYNYNPVISPNSPCLTIFNTAITSLR